MGWGGLVRINGRSLNADRHITSERVERRKRHGQAAEHDVGHGQVDDEYVGDGAHVLVGPDDVHDEHVAEHAQREYEQVDERERGLEHVVLHVLAFDGIRGEVGLARAVASAGRYVYGREHVRRDVLQCFVPAAASAYDDAAAAAAAVGHSPRPPNVRRPRPSHRRC